MFTLIAQLAQLLRPATGRRADTARHLMEQSEARAGLDPREAHELREAAVAYLRVVR